MRSKVRTKRSRAPRAHRSRAYHRVANGIQQWPRSFALYVSLPTVSAVLADHGGISAYSADGIYLYSTKDDPGTTNMAIGEPSIVLPNEKGSPAPGRGCSRSPKPEPTQDQFDCDISMEDQLDRIISEAMSSSSVGEEAQLLEDEVMDEESSEAALDVEDESLVDEDERPLENRGDERYSSTPTIFPRARFGGICNVETIKDGAPCIVSS